MSAPPPPPDEDHAVYGGEEEDLEDEEDENDDVIDEDEEDVDDDSTSSSNLAVTDLPPPPPPSAAEVTIAVAGVTSTSEPKRQRIEDSSVVLEKKPLPLPVDETRRLFQRLWTDEDEIELLQGFLDYNTQRGGLNNSSSHHHDTTAFYDQIKCRLQLDFNKSQLVEKLRRLKKKYRNVVSKLSSGKDYIFKSPHDQATFEISKKIWSGAATATAGGFDEDEGNINPNLTLNFNNFNPILNDHNVNGVMDVHNTNYNNSADKKVPRPRKRSRGGVKIEDKQQPHHTVSDQLPPVAATPMSSVPSAMGSIPNLIEDTVRSCLSPLFKELINNVMNGPRGSRGGFGGLTLNSMMMPLGFGEGSVNFSGGGDGVDEKWRKQQMLELEVYLKRLELVQDQIKSQLDELRSMGS